MSKKKGKKKDAYPLEGSLSTVCTAIENVPADEHGRMFEEFRQAVDDRNVDAINQCIVLWAHAGLCYSEGYSPWGDVPAGTIIL